MAGRKGERNQGSGDYWRGYRQARIDFYLVALDGAKNVLEENRYRSVAYYNGMSAYFERKRREFKELLEGETDHGC